MRASKVFFIVIIVSFFSQIAFAGFNFKSYKPATIHKIIAEHKDVFFGTKHKREIDFQITARHFKYKIICEYLGSKRDINKNAKTLIKYWSKSLSIDPKITNLYQKEILIKHENEEYWIPIQKQLIHYLDREVKKGDNIDLYIMMIGTWKTDWIFIANEFQKR